MIKKLLKKIEHLDNNKKITIKINDEFATYIEAGKLKNALKEKGKIFFEDGCYDVFIDFTKTFPYSSYGWYKRYGLLSFNGKTPTLFRDGDNWKIYKDDLSNIPYYFYDITEKNNGPGFYNLIEEDLMPEEEYEKTYNCYYFENIYQIKIKEFETDTILAKLQV